MKYLSLLILFVPALAHASGVPTKKVYCQIYSSGGSMVYADGYAQVDGTCQIYDSSGGEYDGSCASDGASRQNGSGTYFSGECK